jgi:GNAT superfamily N-acetyltransferase
VRFLAKIQRYQVVGIENPSYQHITVSNAGGSAEGYVAAMAKENISNWLEKELGKTSEKVLKDYSDVPCGAVLKNMWVDEDMRGQGYGASLVSEFLERVESAGAKVVLLISDAHESQRHGFNLQKFYENFGFEKIANTSAGPLMALRL